MSSVMPTEVATRRSTPGANTGQWSRWPFLMGDGDAWAWCAASIAMRSEATAQRPGSVAAVRAPVVLTLGLPDATRTPYNENRQWARGPFSTGYRDTLPWCASLLSILHDATAQRPGSGDVVWAPSVLTLRYHYLPPLHPITKTGSGRDGCS
jgi:hypothetical protein